MDIDLIKDIKIANPNLVNEELNKENEIKSTNFTQAVVKKVLSATEIQENINSILVEKKIAFERKSSIITEDSKSIIEKIANILNENKNFVVSNVYINSTADKKGLKPQDEIISLDDLKCSENDSDTIIKYIKAHEGQNVKTKYLRDGKEYTTNLIPGTFDSTVVCNVCEDYGEIILTSLLILIIGLFAVYLLLRL